jgi:hypothetical protein
MRTITEILLSSNMEPELAVEFESSIREKILTELQISQVKWDLEKIRPMEEKSRNQDVSIHALIERSDLKFETMLAESSARFESIQNKMDLRFESVQKEMNARFDSMQKMMDLRFESVQREMNSRFEALHSEMREGFTIFRWALGAIITSQLMIIGLMLHKSFQ